jgi:hypothetical protein
MTYKDWVQHEASIINSDGCTAVSELYHYCCLEHDLGYHYGRDPRVAHERGWQAAPPINRSEVDKRFRQCIQSHSKLGKWSPVSWIRYAGVRVGGYFLWKH